LTPRRQHGPGRVTTTTTRTHTRVTTYDTLACAAITGMSLRRWARSAPAPDVRTATRGLGPRAQRLEGLTDDQCPRVSPLPELLTPIRRLAEPLNSPSLPLDLTLPFPFPF
jgi:hypothetical protein